MSLDVCHSAAHVSIMTAVVQCPLQNDFFEMGSLISASVPCSHLLGFLGLTDYVHREVHLQASQYLGLWNLKLTDIQGINHR